ncbi:MAG TPA: hypothetical protein VLJ39_17845 [Tepidisphaeraceae bacterium]|nr:hypothetical protein [Tepidisphaeraceae bacterium]
MDQPSAKTDALGAPAKPADLSDEIIQLVEKRPNDRVTCRKIFGDNYRCNWWSPESRSEYDNPAMPGLLVTTHRVRQSRFVTATRTAAGIVLSPASLRRSK